MVKDSKVHSRGGPIRDYVPRTALFEDISEVGCAALLRHAQHVAAYLRLCARRPLTLQLSQDAILAEHVSA